jgi:ABC-2 type transport system permease protein
MTVASQAFANNSTSLFQAKSEGYIEDVLTSPLRAWQLALAYMAGGLVRGFAAALAVLVLAVPFTGGLERPALALAALGLTASSLRRSGSSRGFGPKRSTSTRSSRRS